jgi:hypothetical protein
MIELRMYGLTPYQLNGRQIGIQYGHGTDEYALKIIKCILGKNLSVSAEEVERYLDWLENWKTYIVLNGGTTSTNETSPGTLNLHLQTLKDNGIFSTEFYEPDLGDQLTSVNFIVDERVFKKDENKKYVYLEFEDWIFDIMTHPSFQMNTHDDKKFIRTVRGACKNSDSKELRDYYQAWVDYMGGEKNVFLRGFLENFRLA